MLPGKFVSVVRLVNPTSTKEELEINATVTQPSRRSSARRRYLVALLTRRARWVFSLLIAALLLPFCVVTPVAAAGTSIPIGNLPGWKQIMAEDFNTAVALGSFHTSSYARRFFAYTGGDTFGHGVYDAKRVNSVAGGALDWYLHKENGQPYVSALVPVVPTTGWGQRYGRYSVRYRSDVVPWVQDGVPVVAGQRQLGRGRGRLSRGGIAREERQGKRHLRKHVPTRRYPPRNPR